MKMFGQFINSILKNDMLLENENFSENMIKEYWDSLTLWFKLKGKKNVGSTFRDSFHKLILDLKSIQ